MPKTVRADYQSKVHKPTNFEAFWQGLLRQVEAIPLNPEVVPDPLRTSDDIEAFQVFYHSLDQVRIAAWYCRPSRRAERSPAILFLPGYQMDPPIPKEWARKGYIALSVAPRGELRSMHQLNPGYRNFLTLYRVYHHRSPDLCLSRRLCGHLACNRFFALTPGSRSNPHWGDWYQPGWRPDHLHRRHAARNPCRGSGRPLPLWLPRCHRTDAYL